MVGYDRAFLIAAGVVVAMAGWRGRDFYLGPRRDALFERRGNAGTTAWVDGRVVGCRVQDDDATVRVRLVEPVPTNARSALDAEAARITAWLGGRRASTSTTAEPRSVTCSWRAATDPSGPRTPPTTLHGRRAG